MDEHEHADELPDDPLVRLDPISADAPATIAEDAEGLELRLQLIGARAYLAIAEAWDSGRISPNDPLRPPFEGEVMGLLGVGGGFAPEDLVEARARVAAIEAMIAESEQRRSGRPTTIEQVARDFELKPLAVTILLAAVAPRLRGQIARLYKILANNDKRPLLDEQLLISIIGDTFQRQIARELDADRPLRRYGLVQLTGERPNALISADALVVRFIANRPYDGETDPVLEVRHVDRDLTELHVPRPLIRRALKYLAIADESAPARIVVRGRTGSGRHTLLVSLAAHAGRSLGIIDTAALPKARLPSELEAALRRALLRGLVPCVDGLENLGADDPNVKILVHAVLRRHPGPLAVRLPPDVQPPLDPGYHLVDIPQRNERERTESWTGSLERHGIPLADAAELAARYRIGPGIIERVCIDVARRPETPADAAAWTVELDDAVRQHLDNRLGKTATRVTRLASWADIVLPEELVDSLLEMISRVRHRKKVFEQWGFDKSITTARGITALFSGSPGTGKTMVAGVIARELGLELYRVDVSRIASRWLGETEKNLGELFDAAEDGQVMLLFDEADSLFAKRTEVKSSNDRYANMEVNYLLQRLDTFEGVAVLTTNFGSAIDPAFRRRLTYRVQFPFPDDDMREQLWRSLIPPQVPIDGRINYTRLARKFRLSGGYIRNAALRAAFLAAEEGVSMSQDHLERAVRMEFREIGKLAESGVLE